MSKAWLIGAATTAAIAVVAVAIVLRTPAAPYVTGEKKILGIV